jgi:hypothetical protein
VNQANALDELRGIINYMNQSGVTLPPAMAAACAAAASLPTLQQQTTQIASGRGECSSSNEIDTINSTTSASSPTIDPSTLSGHSKTPIDSIVDGSAILSDHKSDSTRIDRLTDSTFASKVNARSMSEKRPIKSAADNYSADSPDHALAATIQPRKKIKVDPDNNRLSIRSQSSPMIMAGDTYAHHLLNKTHV